MPNALILGATSDIAVAIAHRFAASGYSLSLAARKPEQLQTLCSDLSIRHGQEITPYAFNACAFDTHEAFYESLKEKPDVTVCVFGLMEEEDKAMVDWEVSKSMIDTNFTGAVSILNIVMKAYMTQQSGVIVGISSVAGERGRQSKLIYGSAKAAFSAYLSGLRNLGFDHNVHVVSVKPGFVATKMTEGMDLPGLLTAQPKQVGEAVYQAVKKKKNTIYVKWMWRYIMLIIKMIPEPIFKKLKL